MDTFTLLPRVSLRTSGFDKYVTLRFYPFSCLGNATRRGVGVKAQGILFCPVASRCNLSINHVGIFHLVIILIGMYLLPHHNGMCLRYLYMHHQFHALECNHSIFVRGVTPLTRQDVRGVPLGGRPRQGGAPSGGCPGGAGGRMLVRGVVRLSGGVPRPQYFCQGGARQRVPRPQYFCQGGAREPEDTMK